MWTRGSNESRAEETRISSHDRQEREPSRWPEHEESSGSGERTSSVVERSTGLDLEMDAERATLVVMEAGASWPSWVKDVQCRAPHSMVEVKSNVESIESFAERVQRRLMSLHERGVELLAAVYAAVSPVTDEENAIRFRLCKALVDTLGPAGELVLSGTGWSTCGEDARSRENLLGLAGDLSYRLKERDQTVSVRFSHPPGEALEETSALEESGVHEAPGLRACPGVPYGRSARQIA